MTEATGQGVVRGRILNAEGVYGTILYMALIVANADDDTKASQILLVSLGTVFVFWGAHVYASTITGHGIKGGKETRLRVAFTEARHHLRGMLIATILPSVPLALSVFGVIDMETAVDIALYIGIVVLGVAAYLAFAERKSPWWARILGTIGSVAFGLVVLLFNVIVH